MASFARITRNRQASILKEKRSDVKFTLPTASVAHGGGGRAGDSGASVAKVSRVHRKNPDVVIVVDGDDDDDEEEDEKRGTERRQRGGEGRNGEEQERWVGGSAYVSESLRSSASNAGFVMEFDGNDSERTVEGMGRSRAGSNEDKCDGSWGTSKPGTEGLRIEDDGYVDILEIDDCDEEKCDRSQVSLKPGAEDLKVGEDGVVEVLEIDDSDEESGAESNDQSIRFEVKEGKKLLDDTDEEGELSASAATEMELFTSVEDGEGKEEDAPNDGAERQSECSVEDDEYTGKMGGKESEKKSQTPCNLMMTGCSVGRRTRSRLGKLPRVSYTKYFKTHVSEEEEVKEGKKLLDDTDEEGELSASAATEMELFTSVEDGEGKEEDAPNDGAKRQSECLVEDDEYTGKMGDKESEKKSQTRCNSMMTGCCVGWRTRSCLGKLPRVSYTKYFKTHVSEEEEMESSEEDEALDDDESASENTKLTEEGGTSSFKEQKRCSVPPPKKKNLSGTCAEEGGTSSSKEKKGCSVPPPKKKKRLSGTHILLSMSSEETDTGFSLSSESFGILKQTSDFVSKHYEYKKKLGTLSSPLHLADEHSNFNLDTKGTKSVAHETNVSDREGIMQEGHFNLDAKDNKSVGFETNVSDREGIKQEGHFKLDTKGKESVGHNVSDRERIMHEGLHVRKSKKKKQGTPLETFSVFKLLVDTICNNTEKISADLSPPRNEPCYVEPDVFSFGDEDPKVVEKSNYEKEIDELWAEFHFALAITKMGTYNYYKHQEEEINKENLTTCRSGGKHCFILDEQIGIICKLCSFVNMEIRYIIPSMVTNTIEKSDWRSLNNKSGQLDFKNLSDEFKSSNGQSCNSPVTGTVWDLIPGAYATMYQHQREAFEFMWRNLAGGIHLDELKSGSRSDVVGGCVISHAPGTGKTRLSIVFIQTYMTLFPECKPVIIAPRGMLLTWAEEARKWSVDLPIHNLNSSEYSGMEDKSTLAIAAREYQSIELMRLVKLCSWDKGNSILGVSYNLFKKLTSEASTSFGKILLENPGLLVLDEGHIPRNEHSLIWKVLGKVKTEKRIILSGTPFQNNFVELYNILCLVRPTFAEEISINTSRSSKKQDIFLDKEHDLPERNDGKGMWTHLTSQVNDGNVEEVRSMLKPFVHIHNGSILKDLPGLRECVIVLHPLPQQKSVIDKVKHIGASSKFESEYKYCLASIHPSLITHLNMTEEEASLVDKNLLETLKLNPLVGAKTRFIIEVVRLCSPLNEKVLIFSQYILPLEMIKEQLINEFKWKDGKEVLQLDGKILTRTRQSSISIFNDENSDAKVLLASTKACCEGIHLTGASRVILLDVVWNPAVGRQAISRAYRLGQKKFVYTYNLITSGTGEREKYNKQTEKDRFSKLLFSPEIDFTNAKNNFSESEEGQLKIISEDKILLQITEKLKDKFAHIYYPSKEYCICT